jgi:hypothetical protein
MTLHPLSTDRTSEIVSPEWSVAAKIYRFAAVRNAETVAVDRRLDPRSWAVLDARLSSVQMASCPGGE